MVRLSTSPVALEYCLLQMGRATPAPVFSRAAFRGDAERRLRRNRHAHLGVARSGMGKPAAFRAPRAPTTAGADSGSQLPSAKADGVRPERSVSHM